MSRRSRLGAALAAAALLLATAVSAAPAADETSDSGTRVLDLRAVGYEGGWTAETYFTLRWGLEARRFDPITGVWMAFSGAPVPAPAEPGVLLPEAQATSTYVEIPNQPRTGRAAPGVYTVEVWPTTRATAGPRELVTLKVDNQQPGPAVPRLDAAWYRTDVAPVLRIAHPDGPAPLSGIRGYAIALRRDSPAPPCAGPDRCEVAETDLPGGVADDTVSLGPLTEGIHVVSVVAVSKTGMRSAVLETAPVRIDGTRPDLALAGIDGGWSNRPVRVLARAVDPLSGMAPAGPTGPRTWVAVDGGPATVVPGDEAATIVSGSGVHGVAAGARDAAGNVRGGDGASLPATGVVRIDEDPPTIAFTRAADPADPELIEAALSDPLSGPAPAGGSIGVRPLGSSQAFEPLPTESADGRLRARWDSDAYPRGSYEFRASGYDAAGNLASSTVRGNGVPLVLANPVKVQSLIRFGFGGRQLVWHRCVRKGEGRRCRREVIEAYDRRPAARTVPYGRGVAVGGQAISAAGAPLAGVAVALVETFDPGSAAPARVSQLWTAADGTFVGHLAPGPSRQVEARFGGDRLLTRSSSRRLRLGVQTSVRFRASAGTAAVGGAPVIFGGRILRGDAVIPAYGRPVQLQFRLPGMPWTEFRTVQTDERGRFRYAYSFSDDDSRGVRFLFRAYAPPQPGWPFEPAASRPVAVAGH